MLGGNMKYVLVYLLITTSQGPILESSVHNSKAECLLLRNHYAGIAVAYDGLNTKSRVLINCEALNP